MKTAAGIDIGAETLKTIVLGKAKNGQVEVLSAGTLALGELGLMDESPDKSLAAGEKLKQLIKSARIKADIRRAGVAGGAAGIRYLHIPPVPPWRLDMLVKYEVDEHGGDKDQELTSDYKILDVPETGGQYMVMIGTLKETKAAELLDLGKSCGLGEIEIDLEALALYNAYYHGHGYDSAKTVLIADIGSEDVTVLACKNGALYFARTFLGGGRRFSQAIADELKIELSDADRLKREQAEISMDVMPARTARPVAGTRVIPGVRPAPAGGLPRAGQVGSVNVRPAPGASVGATSGIGAMPVRGPAANLMRSGQNPAIPGQAAQATSADAAKAGLSGSAAAPAASALRSRSSVSSLDTPLSLEELDLMSSPAAAPTFIADSPNPEVAKPAADTSEVLELSLDAETPAPASAPQPAPAKAPELAPFDLEDLSLVPPEPDVIAAPAKQPVRPVPTGYSPRTPAQTAPQQPAPSTLSAEEKPASFDSAQTTEGSMPDFGMASDDLDMARPAAPTVDPRADEDKRKRQLASALTREAAALCAIIENAAGFCRQQTKQPTLKFDCLYITGGGSKLKGLSDFMARRLRMDVLPLEPLKNISLARMPEPQAAGLRAEQHLLAGCVGLAISSLQPGTFNFLLWPAKLKKRKIFWAKGAYLRYAAAMAAASAGLLLYMPYRNAQLLDENDKIAGQNITTAGAENEGLKKAIRENEEKQQRLKQIVDNTMSGHYFLNLLAEMKNRQRIHDDIYLTQVSTSVPQLIRAESDQGGPGAGNGNILTDTRRTTPQNPADQLKELERKAKQGEAENFLEKRRVYIRGFVRSREREKLVPLVEQFYKLLVPYPKDPENKANLFKDIRPLWLDKDEHPEKDYYLREFVLEAYTEGTREEKAGAKDAKGNLKVAAPKTGNAAAPAVSNEPMQPDVQPLNQPPLKTVQDYENQPAQPARPKKTFINPQGQIQGQPVQPNQVQPTQPQNQGQPIKTLPGIIQPRNPVNNQPLPVPRGTVIRQPATQPVTPANPTAPTTPGTQQVFRIDEPAPAPATTRQPRTVQPVQPVQPTQPAPVTLNPALLQPAPAAQPVQPVEQPAAQPQPIVPQPVPQNRNTAPVKPPDPDGNNKTPTPGVKKFIVPVDN